MSPDRRQAPRSPTAKALRSDSRASTNSRVALDKQFVTGQFVSHDDASERRFDFVEAMAYASLFLTFVTVLLSLVAFSSLSSSGDTIEALNWGFVDDFAVPTTTGSYSQWCAQHFSAQQCRAGVKVSGYFSLRRAKLMFRAYSPSLGAYVLNPTEIVVNYNSDKASCLIPDGTGCGDCNSSGKVALAFIILLLLMQCALLVDQIRQVSDPSGFKVIYIIAEIASWLSAVIAVGVMSNSCLQDVQMDVENGAMVVLMAGITIFTIAQIALLFTMFFQVGAGSESGRTTPLPLEHSIQPGPKRV
eukprot:m.728086 g.728086  ORF g.728086 m.728086 type:complete len:302 (+) comp23044_c0_seq3:303-1208(+)